MIKTIDTGKIVDAMEKKEGMCFTAIERLYLEIAVINGAKAQLDIEKEDIRELKEGTK